MQTMQHTHTPRRAQVNLAATLIAEGNRAAAIPDFTRIYRRAESLLLAALALSPAHPFAETNLRTARENLAARGGAAAAAPPPPPLSYAVGRGDARRDTDALRFDCFLLDRLSLWTA